MRLRFLHKAMFVAMLLCQLSICFGKEASDPNDSTKYLNAVRQFADNVLKYGRDTYGPKHTPLFVDGLNIHTHEPVKWIASNGDRWTLSNLASQQNLFRTLDGLTTITGDPKYRQAAMEAIECAFENLRTPNGLLYWGIAAAYDAQGDRLALPYRVGGLSLKWHYPYYELMWEVNPDATKQFIETYWSKLILDWSNLDMNRSTLDLKGPLLNQPWDHKYTGGPVYFETKADGKAFISAGSDLSRAAALLYSLSGDREPLVWSKRLIHRYVETRHPEVGISGSPYNRSRSDSAQYQFRNDFMGHFVLGGTFFPQAHLGLSNPMVRELSLGYLNVAPGIPYSIISGPCWISQLILGDMLGQDGAEFTQWALEEFTAIGKRAYRKNDNSFIPMLIDGTSIEGYVCKRDGSFGAKGTTFNAIPAVPMDFWAYALAYRITEDEFMWEMAHNIAQGLDLGNIGFSPTAKAEMNNNTNCCDPFALLAFLELYKKTQNKTFLQMSHRIGANILAGRFHKGFFIASNKHIYAKFDAFEPLALLHLYAVAEAGRQSIPEIWPNKSMFNGYYRDRYFETDYEVIYSLTESLYPPRTLEEAAAAGDLEEVKSLISQGADVNVRSDGYFLVPLMRAVQGGHKEVVELLLANNADVNVRGSSATALDYAARKGYSEIVELLIKSGADVNAENARGDTPFQYVAYKGNKDIIELLLQKGVTIANIYIAACMGDLAKLEAFSKEGVDINAFDGYGYAPLHYAVQGNQKQALELLITKGADVDVKDDKGHTPLFYAVRDGRDELAQFLIDQGADINYTDKNVYILLSWAIWNEDRDMIKLLVTNGADVNFVAKDDWPFLHYLAENNDRELVELFLSRGAKLNVKDNEGRTELHIAVSEGNRDLARFLVSKGATAPELHLAVCLGDLVRVKSLVEEGMDVDTKDEIGWTPLYWAASTAEEEVAEFLIGKGAGIDVRGNNNRTPLHQAATAGAAKLASLLISKGADSNAWDLGNRTPLHLAAAGGHKDVVELLLANGADVNAKSKDGRGALHRAVQAGHREVVQLLLVNGADVNAKTTRGLTPLDLAKRAGHREIVELLRKHGAKE